jgi:hypothetical protein
LSPHARAGLNSGSVRDHAFHVTASGVTVIFEDLVIRNGQAADNGTSGVSTNPTAQNTNRTGGGILNNGGSVTLDNVIVELCAALGKGDSVVNQNWAYTITFKVTDASGNVTTATARVTVPRSQNGAAAVDDGPNYTVLSGCL